MGVWEWSVTQEGRVWFITMGTTNFKRDELYYKWKLEVGVFFQIINTFSTDFRGTYENFLVGIRNSD